MKKITVMLTFFILIFSLTNCSDGVKKIKLEYKFKPNMILSYEQFGKSQYTIFTNDSLITKNTQSYTIDVQYTFNRQVNDSTTEILETSDWVHYKPKEDGTDGIDTLIFHREMTLQQLGNGKIIDFDFVSEAKAKKSYLKNYFEQGMPVFPKESVNLGHSWTQSYKVVLPEETMEASTTYKVKSFVRESGYDCVVLEFEGNLLIPIEPQMDDESQRRGIDRISAKGSLYFAYNEGFVVLQNEHWTSKGDRTRLSDGKQHDYKIESEYDIEFKLKKAEGF